MRYMLVAIAAAFAALLTIGMTNSPPAPPKASATVKVGIVSEEGSGHGSGVHLGNGVLLTAAHVAEAGAQLSVKNDLGAEAKATVLWRSEPYDIALIKAPLKNTARAPLACVEPHVGQQVHAAGNPGAFENVITWGRVAAKPVYDQGVWKIMQPLDITGGPGMSGGPVFDVANQVVGITVAILQAPGLYNRRWFMFMVPAKAVCDLMGRT